MCIRERLMSCSQHSQGSIMKELSLDILKEGFLDTRRNENGLLAREGCIWKISVGIDQGGLMFSVKKDSVILQKPENKNYPDDRLQDITNIDLPFLILWKPVPMTPPYNI